MKESIFIEIELIKRFGSFKYFPKIAKGKIIKETEKAILFECTNCYYTCQMFNCKCKECKENISWIPKSCFILIKII